MEIKVGIVMPCINLWAKYTRPALDSVIEAMLVADDKRNIVSSVLLIDNASTDETKTEGPKYFSGPTGEGFFERIYHRNEEQWGFQRSVNFGVNHFFDKGYDYVLVLNNDIVLHGNAIWRLVERFEKGGVSMATCLDVTGECFRNPAQLKKIGDKAKETCPEAPHPCFSAFMVNKDCWDKVGEFDEVYFPAYYEDNDYHYRMKLAGLLAITYPPAMFFHWGSATQNEAIGRPLTDSGNQYAQFVRKWGAGPGVEVFTHPYNEEAKAITSTKQKPQ